MTTKILPEEHAFEKYINTQLEKYYGDVVDPKKLADLNKEKIIPTNRKRTLDEAFELLNISVAPQPKASTSKIGLFGNSTSTPPPDSASPDFNPKGPGKK